MIMKKTTLFLILLAGMYFGHAGAEEKGVTAAVVAGNPASGGKTYSTAISNVQGDDVSYKPEMSSSRNRAPDVLLKEFGSLQECANCESPPPNSPVEERELPTHFYNEGKTCDITEVMTTPSLGGESLFSGFVCTSCRADDADAISVSRMGIGEDLVYHVAKALQRYKNESRVKEPPTHAWEEDDGARLYDDDFAAAGGSVQSSVVALDNTAK